jgi:hypothetical protein
MAILMHSVDGGTRFSTKHEADVLAAMNNEGDPGWAYTVERELLPYSMNYGTAYRVSIKDNTGVFVGWL